jgi:mRNA interferase MazF
MKIHCWAALRGRVTVEGDELTFDWPLAFDVANRLPLVAAVVVGTKGENVTRDYPTNVRVSSAESGLPMETDFLCFQIRSLDPHPFFGPPAGRVSGAVLEKIESAVRHCLGL